MPNVQGHKDAQHVLEENEQLLREQIESLRAMHEESNAVLQKMLERQALFIRTTQDMADKQKAFAGFVAGAAACDAVAPRGAESIAEEVVKSDIAATKLGVQPVARSESRDVAHSLTTLNLSNRRSSFVRNIFFQDRGRLPTLREVGLFPWARLATGRVLHTPLFEYFIALCVLANTVTIGVEIDMELLGRDTQAVVVLEYFFVSVYIVEMGMHFFVDGPGCLREGWVLFDFVLVLVGSVSIFFGDFLVAFLKQSGASGDVTKGVEQVLILRMVRLFRLARALRMFSIFKWKLITGFFHSLRTLASTVVLMLITIYIFACLGVELITKDETFRESEVATVLISEHFASVPGIMLTLVQFLTLDSISSIYYPLIMLQPWLCVYFMVILMTLSIAVTNLVSALIVEDALESTARDAETQALAMRKQVKKMVPVIKDLFRALDRSGDGCIQIDEIVEGIRSNHVNIPREMRDVVSLDRLLDLFEFLDLDGSGELDEGEFVDGICHLAITSVPVETTQMLQLLRQQRRDIFLLGSDMRGLRGCPASPRVVGKRSARRSSPPEISI